jgi:predicted SPOUT superfamily RNA methylase MTH1
LSGIEKTTVIATSRKGSFIKNSEVKIAERVKNSENVLVIFGAPKHGVHEIIAKEGSSNVKPEFMINMFPNQATETVRLEEALLGTLAILNASILSRN